MDYIDLKLIDYDIGLSYYFKSSIILLRPSNDNLFNKENDNLMF